MLSVMWEAESSPRVEGTSEKAKPFSVRLDSVKPCLEAVNATGYRKGGGCIPSKFAASSLLFLTNTLGLEVRPPLKSAAR
mmetsp:Transcript_113828/g.213232  ORF Transcript_113828/g.213232 Transcript_113828/m.213232 type:complete len:80 (+) Transcript_113828:1140-1379(+)